MLRAVVGLLCQPFDMNMKYSGTMRSLNLKCHQLPNILQEMSSSCVVYKCMEGMVGVEPSSALTVVVDCSESISWFTHFKRSVHCQFYTHTEPTVRSYVKVIRTPRSHHSDRILPSVRQYT